MGFLRKPSLRTALVVALVLLAGISIAQSGQPPSPFQGVQPGVLDLRKVDLKNQTVSLSGTWKWYWNQLRTPGQPESVFEYTAFPKLWRQSTWRHQPLPAQGYATYALTVLLPPKLTSLTMSVPDVYSSYRLFVNGQELARNGTPGTNPASTTPFWGPQLVRVFAPGEKMEVLLQIANFHHSKGGPFKKIQLGNPDRMRARWYRTQALDFFLTGCIFMGGLFFLGLFLFGRKERAILYFALFCLLYSYRIVGSGQYAVHSLFPEISWFVSIRLEYLSLFLGVGVFVLYTLELYPQDVIPWLIKGMAWICFSFAVLTIVLPVVLFSQLITPFLFLMFAYIGYAFYVYLQAARKKRPGAQYALMSTGVLLAVFFAINLEYFGIATPTNAAIFVGYVGFFFLQSLVLSYRFAFVFRRAKEQAEEGLRAKSDFLSTMSHEIRTPLNAVIGMTHLLLGDNPRPDQKEQLDVMLFSANNLLNIVNDILDFNKIEAGKISFEIIPMDLAAIAQNIVSGYQKVASDQGLELQLYLDPRLKTRVLGDPTRTTQVVTNLLHNALKFTQKGWVRLSLNVEEATEGTLTVTIAVEDTGIGISPEKQKLIFERFTQADSSTSRSFGGTGLGLAICKRILELQGIALQLRSEPDQGSTFFFTQTFVPVPESAAPAAPKPVKSTAEKPLRGVCLLLVEDSPMNVLAARGILTRWGAEVDVAQNGKEALEKLDSTRHQLVLMDLHMPVMDGYEATEHLRERGELLPIIALTASLAHEVEAEIRKIGLDDVVVKPFDPEQLLGTILKFLRPAETV